MGRACAIRGCIAVIRRRAGRNSVRLAGFNFVRFLESCVLACVGNLLDFGAHSEAMLYFWSALWWGFVIERQSSQINRVPVLGDAKWHVNLIDAVLCT